MIRSLTLCSLSDLFILMAWSQTGPKQPQSARKYSPFKAYGNILNPYLWCSVLSPLFLLESNLHLPNNSVAVNDIYICMRGHDNHYDEQRLGLTEALSQTLETHSSQRVKWTGEHITRHSPTPH